MGQGTELKKALDALTPQSHQAQAGSANFDEIELDEFEIEEALRRGREEKFYRIQREVYRAKLFADTQPKRYSAAELFKFYKDKYTVDDDNMHAIQQLCHYFSEAERFEGDLKKGLLLMGGVGIGKSTLMQFFVKNQVCSYRIMSCRDIESKFSTDGDDIVRQCSYMQPVATNSDPFGHKEIGMCFDDLGTEANAKHYGKEKNVMAEIILNRYDNMLDFRATHITTNLNAERLKAEYGARVTDRMREMFNVIEFPENAKSRRS
jgi:DNA replication protein DnaC